MIKACEICGEEFQTTRKAARYCGMKCVGEARRRGILASPKKSPEESFRRTCQNCGKTFLVSKPSIQQKYCSTACSTIHSLPQARRALREKGYYHENGHYQRTCKQCGDKFIDTARRGNRQFCSRQCASAARNTRVTLFCHTCGTPYGVKKHAVSTSRFCSYKCAAADFRTRTGSMSPRWSPGAKSKTSEGYIRIIDHEHPRASKSGHVLEHILVAEMNLGRSLNPGEVVHHINGVKDDNRPENLMVLPSQTAHMRLHIAERGRMKVSMEPSAN